MPRAQLTIGELFRLLPDVEELDGLRLSLAGRAIPDPEKAWEKSCVYSTVDMRVVDRPRVDEALSEAEAALHASVSELFAVLRPVVEAHLAGDDAEAARRLVRLGEQHEGAGRYRSARQIFDAALSLSLPLADKGPQILALRRIARVALARGEFAEAAAHYARSTRLAQDAGDLRGELIGRTGTGNVLLMQGRWADVERCYREALERLDEPGQAELPLERAQLYTNLGMITTRQDRMAEAEEWFGRALALWTTVDSPEDLAVCHHNHGLLRERQGRREEARAMFRRALELPISSALRAAIAMDLAESHLRDGSLMEAERLAREAEQHALAARSPYYLGHMYRGLGNIARAKREGEGFVFFEKALEIARARDLPFLEGDTLVDYALLRNEMGGTEEARSYVQRALQIFRELGAVHEQARAEGVLRNLADPQPEAVAG